MIDIPVNHAFFFLSSPAPDSPCTVNENIATLKLFCNFVDNSEIFNLGVKMDQNLISKIQAFFSFRPVIKAWIFGSMSRNEATQESDVDILVQFDQGAGVSLFDHVQMAQELGKILKRTVDLVTEGTLHTWVKDSVDTDKILIYERKTA